ncbi:MAG TPA: outer membrane protein [Methylocella sp.]|nr:outer membrane protein [Methylocella sp.]
MRRSLLLASAGAIALSASAALAADLPSRAPPPPYVPPAPIFTWTGVYVGGQIGYAWASDSTNFTTADPDRPFFNASTNPNGVIGGAHVGYNLQYNQWLVGLEGSVDGTSVSGSNFLAPQPGFLHLVHPPLSVTGKANIQGSIRGRIGVAWDRLLIYGTGGVTFAGIEDDYNLGAPFFLTSNISKTRAGWTVGGGVEYAVTNNWSVRVEYRYNNWGSYNDFPFPTLGNGVIFSPIARHNFTQSQVQAGFSYKFDTFAPPPVVAKY